MRELRDLMIELQTTLTALPYERYVNVVIMMIEELADSCAAETPQSSRTLIERTLSAARAGVVPRVGRPLCAAWRRHLPTMLSKGDRVYATGFICTMFADEKEGGRHYTAAEFIPTAFNGPIRNPPPLSTLAANRSSVKLDHEHPHVVMLNHFLALARSAAGTGSPTRTAPTIP